MVLCRPKAVLDYMQFTFGISTQLVPYLFNQSFMQENGYYYHERPHGVKGTIESFADIFSTANIESILKLPFVKSLNKYFIIIYKIR